MMASAGTPRRSPVRRFRPPSPDARAHGILASAGSPRRPPTDPGRRDAHGAGREPRLWPGFPAERGDRRLRPTGPGAGRPGAGLRPGPGRCGSPVSTGGTPTEHGTGGFGRSNPSAERRENRLRPETPECSEGPTGFGRGVPSGARDPRFRPVDPPAEPASAGKPVAERKGRLRSNRPQAARDPEASALVDPKAEQGSLGFDRRSPGDAGRTTSVGLPQAKR